MKKRLASHSVFLYTIKVSWGRGGIGRRNGLKIRWEKSRVGSSPTVPTIVYLQSTSYGSVAKW